MHPQPALDRLLKHSKNFSTLQGTDAAGTLMKAIGGALAPDIRKDILRHQLTFPYGKIFTRMMRTFQLESAARQQVMANK